VARLGPPARPAARRILLTGLSSALGGRLAQALEADPEIEAIVGVDTGDPRHELARTEFVRVALERRPLERIIAAAGIDTVLDTRLITAAPAASPARREAVDAAQTAELCAACAAPGSPVRQLVLSSSAHVYGTGSGDPAFLTEDMAGAREPATGLERALVAAERAAAELAAGRPEMRVAIVRLAEEIGGERRGSLSALLSLPVIPGILGFDPRVQLIHSDDVVGVLAHAARAGLSGAYNAAGDGVLVLSEIAGLLGKPFVPVLPPWGIGFAAGPLRRLGVRVPVELVRQLRYGRGLDNRRLKASGYRYAYTTREALLRLRSEQRLRPLLEAGSEAYRYDPAVEEFLRWSPSVQSARARTPAAAPVPAGAYDRLGVGELIDLIPSLEPDALEALRVYESAHQARRAVLDALGHALARHESR
jgi:UDP-glucose 4-epimerase